MDAIDLVVFDMAGTTIENSGQVLAAYLDALRENGVDVSADEVLEWMGAPKRQVLRFFVQDRFGDADPDNDTRIERTYADFRRRLESRYVNEGVRAVPGVEHTLRWLRERDIKIALTTGFYRKVTDIILQATGWRERLIDASFCSDDVLQGRPAPFMIFRAMEATGVTDVRRVIKVGDTALDLLAGMNAGVRGVVGVLSGQQGFEQLGRVEHTNIIRSVAALPDLILDVYD